MDSLKGTVIIFLIMILAHSCDNTRRISQGTAEAVIHFGRTGGFTNIPDEYFITKKGKVFKTSGNGTTIINNIPVRKVKSIISKLEESGFDKIELNEPGNISYFIKVKTSEYEKSVIWNDMTQHDNLKNIYKELLMTLKP